MNAIGATTKVLDPAVRALGKIKTGMAVKVLSSIDMVERVGVLSMILVGVET